MSFAIEQRESGNWVPLSTDVVTKEKREFGRLAVALAVIKTLRQKDPNESFRIRNTKNGQIHMGW